jgi:hypothetical protein
MTKIEDRFFVVALDRKNFLKNRLQSGHFPFRGRDVFLQKIDVRVELNLNQIRGLDAFLDGSEVDTF